MTMILIGSRALALRAPHLLHRKPLDFDFVCSRQECEEWLDKNKDKIKIEKQYELPEFSKIICEGSPNIEFEIVQPGSSAELLMAVVENDPETTQSPFGLIPPQNCLLSIKDARKHKKFETPRGNGLFWKHASDWHALKSNGAEITDGYKDFVALREKETYTHKMPKLNVNRAEFFDEKMNGVHQIVIHDDIHKAIAIGEKPAYEYYLQDGSEVKTSNKKFLACSEYVQMCGSLEEAGTLATERAKIGKTNPWSDDYAFKFALAKVCTTITGGIFRDRTFRRLPQLIKMYQASYTDYFERFKKALREGRVGYMPGCSELDIAELLKE
jgi:hypothetical protein